MKNTYLVVGARTPMGKYGGALAEVRPDDMAALVIQAVIERAGIAPEAVDEVVLGAANQAGEDNRNVARMATLLAGLPYEVPAYTVNRLCASGMTAIIAASDSIASGAADIVIAGGVESMTRAPWVMAKAAKAWQFPPEVFETSLGWRFTNPRMRELDEGLATLSMGETAEKVATLHNISRERSEKYALNSHIKAIAARSVVAEDIISVNTPHGLVDQDENPRENASLESLAKLKLAFTSEGTQTAGTSSPLTDGASAIMVASEDALEKYSLKPIARIIGAQSAGVKPSIMGLGPVASTKKLFERIGWNMAELSTVELNEAFASQTLGCIDELGLDESIVNPEGGAIALGHPLGSSGSRITWALARRLSANHKPGSRGLATLCVGVGQGVSIAIEAC